MTHDALIQRFYAAFAHRDGAAMAACYAPDARFSDPVFPALSGDEVGAMWRMLTSSSDDLRIQLLDHTASDDEGFARWSAHYTFTQTGRPVVNEVTSTFRFRDDLIAEQTDSFGFHRWARQALGAPGLFLGWTPFLRAAVQRSAAGSLARFLARE